MTFSGQKETQLIIFPEPITVEFDRPLNPYGRNGLSLKEKIDNYDYENIDIKQQEKIKEFLVELDNDNKKANRIKTLRRNASKLRKIVLSNMDQYKHKDKFLTLTFRIDPESIDNADYELDKFIKRLRYKYGKGILIAGIRELQKENNRNAIHYHLFLFNCPYIPHSELLLLWCKGNQYMDIEKPSGVNIQAIRKGLNQVINYLTGYALKDLLNEEDWLQGRKTLILSQGLKKPVIVDYEKLQDTPLKPETFKKAFCFIDTRVECYIT